MKKLLYKEFALSMHPMCYVFALVFPILILIPNFPLFVGTLYIIPSFSILFLGANKGKQSNDLFYTALLPIRKQDIVKARLLSVIALEAITLTMMAIFVPAKMAIEQAMGSEGQVFTTAGIISSFAFSILGYMVVNTIFFLMFYHNGRSIIAPTLISTFTYLIFILVFTSVLPAVNPETGEAIIPGYYNIFVNTHPGIQFAYVGAAMVLFAIDAFLIYKKASQELLKVDL